MAENKKLLNRALRKNRVRAKVSGTAERPRLTVTISNLHVSAQLIDDVAGKTLAAATTVGTKATGTMAEKSAAIAWLKVVAASDLRLWLLLVTAKIKLASVLLRVQTFKLQLLRLHQSLKST